MISKRVQALQCIFLHVVPFLNDRMKGALNPRSMLFLKSSTRKKKVRKLGCQQMLETSSDNGRREIIESKDSAAILHLD